MKVMLIEDEQPALEKLILQLKNYSEPVEIVATCDSIQASISHLKTNGTPDLIFSDIALSDGNAFDIFKTITIDCPVIFITAFDTWLLEAFELNSIDYLLKPVSEARLFAALNKYKSLQKHFSGNLTQFLMQEPNSNNSKSRYVVKKGISYQAVRVEDIAYFISEHKITFLVDVSGNKYIIEKSLQELETELDSKQFFRINRKFIANFSSIGKFKSFSKGKILIELIPAPNDEVIVSQENAAHFKEWIKG